MTEKIFQKAILKFNNCNTKHKTLAKRSSFQVKSNSNKLIIINSRNKFFEVDYKFFERVINRYNNSDQKKYFTSNYTDTNWKGCPSRIFAPYVASIIKDLIEESEKR
jgi:hypothetical protein